MSLLLCHVNITPFTSRQCYSFLRHDNTTPWQAVSSFLVRQLVILLLMSWLLIILLAWLFLKCLQQITPLESRLLVRIVFFYSGHLLLAWSAIGQLIKSVGVACCVSLYC